MSSDGVDVNLPDELGCPSDSRDTPLASVADVRFSGVNKVSQPSEVPVRLCNYIDVYNNDYITADMDFMHATATCAEIERFGLRVGDVIITKDSETPDDIGVSAVVDSTAPDLVCGYHLALIRPHRAAVDSTFLAKQLSHDRLARYFGQHANGSTRYGLSTAAIANAPLRLPKDLRTQQASSAIMRWLDEAIAATEAVIGKLKQVRAGLLHDLLTRGLDEHGQLRDPRAHPEQFKSSRLGRIPQDWNAGVLNDLVQADRPIAYGILMPGRGFPGGVPVIKVKDIKDGRIDTSDLLLTDPKIDEAYRRSRVVRNDLLFTIRGTVGRMALVPPELENANITQDTARVACPSANPVFVARWLEMEAPTRFISVHTLGVAVQGINLRDVRRIPTVIVPRPEQDAMVALVEAHESQVRQEESVLCKLRALKSGLMTDLLTGRVRVPVSIFQEVP